MLLWQCIVKLHSDCFQLASDKENNTTWINSNQHYSSMSIALESTGKYREGQSTEIWLFFKVGYHFVANDPAIECARDSCLFGSICCYPLLHTGWCIQPKSWLAWPPLSFPLEEIENTKHLLSHKKHFLTPSVSTGLGLCPLHSHSCNKWISI